MLLKFSKKTNILLVFLFKTLLMSAQDNYEIQVYAAPTMDKGFTMFELHTNYTFDAEQNIVNGVRPSYHAFHETIEITHGFTDNFEVGIYLFSHASSDYGLQYVGSHIRPRISAPASWKLPIGLSLSMELGYQRRVYSEDTWNLEIRPIIDKDFGKFYVAFNPVLGKSFQGVNQSETFSFEPNFKAAATVSKLVSLGVEYYGSLGTLAHFDPTAQQIHAIYGVIDLEFSPEWEFNFGIGKGLTVNTEGLVAKLILGRKIQTVRKKH